MDAAILVVSAVDGIMPQTREHLLLCKQLGVPYVIVYLNMVDLVQESVVFELAELELKHYLSATGYDIKNLFIIRGSALSALKGDEHGEESIRKLLEVMDNKMGSSSLEKPFSLPIDHALYIPVTLYQ